MIENKTILVTGATGFIGLNVVKYLLSSDVKEIIVTTHTDRSYYYDNLLDHEKVTVHKVDLTKEEDCIKVTKNVDYAILSGAVSFGASFIQNNPLGLVNDNIIMNVRMLDACYQNGVKKVIYYGSTTGYPDTAETMLENDMFKGDPFDRYFSVGWMKRYTEILMRLYAEKLKLMDCTVLRLSNVYGPYDKFNLETSHVLPAMVRKFYEKRFPLEVWGDGEDSRDLIYVEDVVTATLSCLQCRGFNAYNIGYGKNYTVNDIIAILCDIQQSKPEIVYVKDKPKMIKKRCVSVDKVKKDIGFSAKTPLRKGIEKTLTWLDGNIKDIYR